MMVKIRPVTCAWHHRDEFQWQPTPSSNGSWYMIMSRNILRFPYGDPELRREVGIETRHVKNALFSGLPVHVRCVYDRATRKLYVLEPNGKAK